MHPPTRYTNELKPDTNFEWTICSEFIKETLMTGENNKQTQKSSTNLIWIDLEMTGLDTISDHIIEIATIITDSNLNELAEGPVIAIRQGRTILNAMDEWNTRQH